MCKEQVDSGRGVDIETCGICDEAYATIGEQGEVETSVEDVNA